MPSAGLQIRARRVALAALCLAGILGAGAARAQALSPEVSRGLAWLQGQIQADGSLAGEAGSVATGLQNRAEAAQTLKLFSTVPVSLVDAIAAESEDNTEYLARRVVSLSLAGRDPSPLLATLSARQNSDGGFGGGPGYDSDALDTAWALIALRSATAPAGVPAALGYLGLAQAFDGSYSAPGRPDVETTAVAVLALAIYANQFNSFTAISRAVPYLLAQRDPVQQWGNSAFLTATVYAAIHDFIPLEPTATSVRAFLVSLQGPDGSWDGGDPFSTALALRALALSGTAPANPTLGVVRGRIIDSQTRLGLNGVTVSLSGPSTPAPATSAAGAFEFRDLFPGAYTLQLSLNQYGAITFSTTLQAGQTLDFGAIALTKNGQSTTGTVRGTVSDASTRLPLPGAAVSLSSGESATTDAGGNYQISDVAPGNLIVVANKAGYASSPGSGSLAIGGTMIFSPNLVPVTQSAGAAIEGVVIDAVTGAPLSGAAITLTGSTQASATSDAQGRYRIAPLNPGVVTVSVVRAGYRSATSKVTVIADTTLEYSPRLQLPGTGTAKLFGVSSQGDQSTNQIFRYELAGPSGTPVLSLALANPSLDRPSSVAFRETGEMFVVNRGAPTPGAGSFLRFSDPGGTPSFVSIFGSAFVSGPQFATFKADELFVAQRFGGNVLRFTFDSAGNPLGNGIIAAGLASNAPRGIAANPATGELFVSQCCGVDQINRYVFDATGNAVPNGSITGGGLNNPQDMAFSARGELFVANAGGNSVSRFTFDAAGNAFPNGQISGNALNGPMGLDFSPWGELFVANGGAAVVSRWTFDSAFNAVPNGSFATPATLGDIQFMPSGPGVRGVALDASSDQPIAGVLVQAIVGNATRTMVTGADGRFELDGLPSGQAQISFTLNGYLSQSFAIELSALTDIDIGAVRMRKSGVGVFLPDLVVRSVDTQQLVSDPLSFALSGSLTATIANQGTAPTTADFKARAFYDANRNGVYDAGVDLLLGEGQTGGTLAVNATVQVAIPLAGTLPFRDAPIQVWADSDQSVVETNELNNVGAAACQVTPPPTFVDIATQGVASTNSAYQPAHDAIDGNLGTLWNAGGFASAAFPLWLVVDLRSPVQASSIQLWSVQVTPDYIFLNTTNIYNLYVGNDGVTWTKIASGVLAQSDRPELFTNTIPLAANFPAFRYVKYEVVGGTAWAHLFELQVWTTQQAPPVTVSDLTLSALRLTDMGSGQLRLSARVGNGGATASPATTASFYDGDPAAGGALLGSAAVGALQPGQFLDVNLLGSLPISGQNDLFAVVDPANQIAECRETNNKASTPAQPVLTGGIAVATDASSYGAQSPVRVSAAVVNTSPLAATFAVAVRIEDGSGAVVATFPPHTGLALAAGANTIVTETWNTGATLAGAYQAKADLLDAAGLAYASATAPFSIGAGQVTVSAKVSVDKQLYQPSETVLVTSRLANLTENQPLDNLTAVTTVSNPDGSARFTKSEPIAQLAQSALRDFNYALPLGFASAGTYSVSLNLSDALGALLASSSTSFTVGSSAVSGSGLAGSVSAAPKPVPFGDPIAFNATVSNLGNADIPALDLKLTVVDPAATQVLAAFPATIALAHQQAAPLSFAWPANAPVGGTYVAVLSATLGAATITLAQDAFTIAPPVTRVSGTLTTAPKQVPQGVPVALTANVSNVGFGVVTGLPISVTVTNSATLQVVAQFSDSLAIGVQQSTQRVFTWPATGAVGTGYTATLTATVNGVARTLAQDSFSIIAPPVQLDVSLAGLKQARVLVLLSCQFRDDDNDDRDYDHDSSRSDSDKPSCTSQKSAFLASYLSGLGLNYLITSKDDDFTRAFRSGQYNTYWITGGAMKLDDDLTEEIREAVFRGDALFLDAVHDERNHGLDAIAGTDVHGKLSVPDRAVTVNGPLFAPGTLPSSGRPLKLDLTTGAVQAVFAAAPTRPAIVSNQYGQGRAVLFAYDLVGTLMTQPSGALNDLVSAAFGWLAPAPAAVLEARTYAVLRAKVTNVGIAADLKATFTPPAGATVLGTAPAATPDANGRPVWTFSLDSGATKNLDIALRLAANTGTFTASISINSTRGDLATPFSTSATLNVESADTVAPRVAGELAALAVASNDRSDRDHAVSSIRAAQASLASGDSGRAIAQLVDAAERLLKITSVDVAPYRVEVDRLLQEAEARWFIAQP